VSHNKNFHNKYYYSPQISNGKTTIALVGEKGSPRRCGGMGDILSGTIGVMHYWALQHQKKNKKNKMASTTSAGTEEEEEQGQEDIEDEFQGIEPAMWACWGGSFITKATASKAFSVHARSTTAPDLIDHLGEVFEEEFPSKKGHPGKMK
jgi:ATP-dependent NAD(P)H-hydrate dehydratase